MPQPCCSFDRAYESDSNSSDFDADELNQDIIESKLNAIADMIPNEHDRDTLAAFYQYNHSSSTEYIKQDPKESSVPNHIDIESNYPGLMAIADANRSHRTTFPPCDRNTQYDAENTTKHIAGLQTSQKQKLCKKVDKLDLNFEDELKAIPDSNWETAKSYKMKNVIVGAINVVDCYESESSQSGDVNKDGEETEQDKN